MANEIVQKITWYEKGDFSMPDPVCDFCDEPIDKYPCPIKGSYALCSRCRDELGITDGNTEYFESAAYNLGMEPKQHSINCGGR